MDLRSDELRYSERPWEEDDGRNPHGQAKEANVADTP
jgi:hypothetical protein